MSRIAFDPETIRLLATVLKESGLTEIDMAEGDTRLRLIFAPPVVAAPPPAAQVVVNSAPAQPPATPAPAEEPPPPAGAIPSPMVGIAYLSAEPGATPFVTVGQQVTAGQTVLLIEAMKTFNQIKAPHAGTVTQILVASGQPVEYGQPLLVIG